MGPIDGVLELALEGEAVPACISWFREVLRSSSRCVATGGHAQSGKGVEVSEMQVKGQILAPLGRSHESQG